MLCLPSERVNKIEIRIEEASGIFQLRVVADVFVQNGDCGPLDQLPAGTGDIILQTRQLIHEKHKSKIQESDKD